MLLSPLPRRRLAAVLLPALAVVSVISLGRPAKAQSLNAALVDVPKPSSARAEAPPEAQEAPALTMFPHADSEYCLQNIPPMFVTVFHKLPRNGHNGHNGHSHTNGKNHGNGNGKH